MNPMKILIVDDEPHLRTLIQQALEELEDDGVELLTATNGEEALETIRSEQPKMVFLDVMMPKKNGFDVCHAVKRELGMDHIYIVLLTAKGQEFDRQRGIEVGADIYMTKPFDPDALVAKARSVLGLAELGNLKHARPEPASPSRPENPPVWTSSGSSASRWMPIYASSIQPGKYFSESFRTGLTIPVFTIRSYRVKRKSRQRSRIGHDISRDGCELLSHLADRESQQRALASETLTLYREIHLIEQLSEELAALLNVSAISETALAQAQSAHSRLARCGICEGQLQWRHSKLQPHVGDLRSRLPQHRFCLSLLPSSNEAPGKL